MVKCDLSKNIIIKKKERKPYSTPAAMLLFPDSSVDYLGAEWEAAGEFDPHGRETRSRLGVTCRGESSRSSQGTLQTQVNTKWKVSVVVFLDTVLVLLNKNRRSVEFESSTPISSFKSRNIANAHC